MDFDILHRVVFISGIVVLIAALVINARRTNNWVGLIKFWQPRVAMSPTEFKVHRVGVALMIAGVVLSLLSQLL
ncbi:MAG: hypothetical protein ACPGUF_01670 [Litorivicinus sp.]